MVQTCLQLAMGDHPAVERGLAGLARVPREHPVLQMTVDALPARFVLTLDQVDTALPELQPVFPIAKEREHVHLQVEI